MMLKMSAAAKPAVGLPVAKPAPAAKPALAARPAPKTAPGIADKPAPKPVAPAGAVSPKRRLVALLLCFFCGVFSIHRFYVGKVGSAIIQLVCVWLGPLISYYVIAFRKASPAVGYLICIIFCGSVLMDFIMIIAGKFTDNQKLPVINW
jgi:TM2 domain-containing membrane protein YozV